MKIDKATTAELKKQNRNMIYRYIYEMRKTSKQEIAAALGLSLPTISQNVHYLESLGLIERKGVFASSGGRKPQAIQCVVNSRVAIGIEIHQTRILFVCIDIYGKIIAEHELEATYSLDKAFYQMVGQAFGLFVKKMKMPLEKILGAGISLQGIVSNDGTEIIYGKILNNTGVKLEEFTKVLPVPCRFLHDADAAAIGELNFDTTLQNVLYLAIANNVGSALIHDRKIYHGIDSFGGLFEHLIIIHQNGETCYCGRRGCLETVGSLEALCGGEVGLGGFFAEVRRGNQPYVLQWHDYLEYLAIAIDSMHMIINSDVVIGGPLTGFVIDEDIALLNDLVNKKRFFPKPKAFIKMGDNTAKIAAIGNGLLYIYEFIESI